MKRNWEYKKLGDVCTVVGGSTPKTNIPEYWGGENYWVTPAELTGDKYIESTERTITDEAVAKTNLTLLPVGTVLLSSRAPIGKVCITRSPMYCNQGFKNIVCSKYLLNEYVYWWLKGKTDYLNSLGVGATFKEISKRTVEQIVIPVPPLEEQSRIVAELDLLTGIIDKQNAQLKELDNLAQAIFYDMFGDPIENPKRWEVKKLEGLCKVITKGTTPTTLGYPFVSNGIGFVKVEAFSNGLIDVSKLSYVSEECNLALARSQLQENDLLVCIAGATIGKMALVTKNVLPANTNQACAIVRLISIENLSYIYAFLKQRFAYDVQNMGKGVAQPNLSLGQIRDLDIPLPPLTLQQSFAEKIQSIEKQKETIRASIADTQKLLDYTMDKYFG